MTVFVLLVAIAAVIQVAAYVPVMPSILFYIDAPFWLLAGGYSLVVLHSGAAWSDIYYYLFWLFGIGFTFLCIMEGMFVKKSDVKAMREQKKAEAYVNDDNDKREKENEEEERDEYGNKVSQRVKDIHERSRIRQERYSR